jgi:hypothetical protein
VDVFTQLWLVWLMMAAAIEGVALFNKARGDTLSEHVWKWFSIRDKGRGWLIRRSALAAFMIWLTLHFLIGGR